MRMRGVVCGTTGTPPVGPGWAWCQTTSLDSNTETSRCSRQIFSSQRIYLNIERMWAEEWDITLQTSWNTRQNAWTSGDIYCDIPNITFKLSARRQHCYLWKCHQWYFVHNIRPQRCIPGRNKASGECSRVRWWRSDHWQFWPGAPVSHSESSPAFPSSPADV